MPKTPALIIAGLLGALAVGCAVRFQQVDAAAPHALLAVPPQQAQWARGLFFEPLEFNGLPRPRNWLVEHFRIPPGEFRLQARVAQEAMQGTCRLEFATVAGESYLLDASLAGDVFTLQVSHEGRVVAQCDAPAAVLPTPARIPGVPLR